MYEIDENINPFPGLRAFEEDEEYLFFGRERLVDELLIKLRSNHFLTVIGTSGSGKSSVVKSGLLPALHAGFMIKAGSSWRITSLRPGNSPIGNLAEALARPGVLLKEEEPTEMDLIFTETTLRRSNRGLIEAIKQARLPEHDNILIVIDQFEEIFRFSRYEDTDKDGKRDSETFVELIMEATSKKEVPVYVVITIRSDFLGDCTQFRRLPEAISECQHLIPRMTREEIRSAIVGPIAVGGAAITPSLESQLLNDVGNNPDHLPMLQHALMRTWEHWQKYDKEEEPLSLKHYETIGTIKNALSQHADEAYEELRDERLQHICEVLFKALTDKGPNGRGVRRPTKVKEICSLAVATKEEVIEVIDAFRKPGRTFIMPPASVKIDYKTVIDISHESLMRVWERLIRWVDEEAQSAELYMRISQAALLHKQGKLGLWRNPELQIAINWQKENEPNQAWGKRYNNYFEDAINFIDKSKKRLKFEIAQKEREQKAKFRRTRRFTFLLGIAVLISMLLLIYAGAQNKNAKISAEKAIQNEKIAKENEKRASDNAEIAKQNEQFALEAKIQSDLAKEEAIKAKNRADIASAEARKQAKIAKIEAEHARLTQARANIEAENARISEQRASEENKKARFLLYVAKAKELSFKSSIMKGNDTLKAILAATAYQLHQRAFQEFEGYTIGNESECPMEVFNALQKAYFSFTDDNVHEGEILALTLDRLSGKIAFTDRSGNLALAGLSIVDDKMLPKVQVDKKVEVGDEYFIRSLAFNSNSTKLAYGTLEGIAYIVDTKKAAKESIHNAPDQSIISMTFHPEKDWLILSQSDNSIYVYDISENKKISSLKTTHFVRKIELLASNKLVGVDEVGNILLWDFNEGYLGKASVIYNLKQPLHTFTYNKKYNWLAVGSSNGGIFIFDLNAETTETIKPRKLSKVHEGVVTALSFSPDGNKLASASFDGTILVWEINSKAVERLIDYIPILVDNGDQKVFSIAFDMSSDYILFGDREHLNLRTVNANLLYKKLLKTIDNKSLTQIQWEYFVGNDIHKF